MDEEQTETMGYNVLPESLGALKKINSSGDVEHLGNVWFTDRPYNVFPTRMLSIGDDLHLCAGYGNADEVLRYNSLASQADNMVHIVYGKTLHYVASEILTEWQCLCGVSGTGEECQRHAVI